MNVSPKKAKNAGVIDKSDAGTDAAIIWLCDLNPKSLERVRSTFRVVGVSNDPADVLNAPSADAIALVVPASHPFHL